MSGFSKKNIKRCQNFIKKCQNWGLTKILFQEFFVNPFNKKPRKIFEQNSGVAI